MIAEKDYYADADGKPTTDPKKSTAYIVRKGVFIDARTAQRYGFNAKGHIPSLESRMAPDAKIVTDEGSKTKPEHEGAEKSKAATKTTATTVKKAEPKGAKKNG